MDASVRLDMDEIKRRCEHCRNGFTPHKNTEGDFDHVFSEQKPEGVIAYGIKCGGNDLRRAWDEARCEEWNGIDKKKIASKGTGSKMRDG